MTHSGCDTVRRGGEEPELSPILLLTLIAHVSLTRFTPREEDCGNAIIISRKRKSSSASLTEIQSVKTVLSFVEMVDQLLFGFQEKGDSVQVSF